jgi:hypothetical protein
MTPIEVEALADAALGVDDGAVDLVRRQVHEAGREIGQKDLETQPDLEVFPRRDIRFAHRIP